MALTVQSVLPREQFPRALGVQPGSGIMERDALHLDRSAFRLPHAEMWSRYAL